jgi:acetoin utilization deacetylase AcuC-like enzyme
VKTIYSPAHLHHAPAKEFLDGALVDVFEMPQRAELILQAVRDADLGPVLAPDDFGMAPIQAIHDADYLEFLKSAYARWIADGRPASAVYPDTFYKPAFRHRPTRIGALAGIYVMDMSAPITGGTWQAAYWSAQTALSAARLVRSGERAAFALCRPPGHHAHANIAGGYCYLNNIAIAAQWLRSQGAARVSILDIDVHHGNGTQHIFYLRDDVQFVSLHGDPDWEYPYFLGGRDERGEGAGLGFNHNHPLPKGADTAQFLRELDAACAEIAGYQPDHVLVSLGVDTFEGDPIGGLAVAADAYPRIGARLAQLGLPTVFIMEGGYAVAQLGNNVASVLAGFAASSSSSQPTP